MSTENNNAAVDPRDAKVDAATPTDAEATLAAQDLTGADLTPEAIAAAEEAKKTEEAATLEAAKEPAAIAEAATNQAALDAIANAQKAVDSIYVPPEVPEPQPDMDFQAEFDKLKNEYDDGLSLDEYQQRFSKLNTAQSRFEARKAVWEDSVAARNTALELRTKAEADLATAAASVASQDWDTTVMSFQAEHAEFFKVPAQVTALQVKIGAIDNENRAAGVVLTNAELLQRASNAVFAEFKYVPAPVKSPEQIKTEAIAGRRPDVDFQTLGSAPAAQSITPNGSENFAALDALDASALEDALARMPLDQRQAYLSGAPGATTTGRE